jgi:hypothetical protein
MFYSTSYQLIMSEPVYIKDPVKYFRRPSRKDPKIQCRYCARTIDAEPRKGINDRRRHHLSWCPDFKEKVINENIHTSDEHDTKQGESDTEGKYTLEEDGKTDLEEENVKTERMEKEFPEKHEIESRHMEAGQSTYSYQGFCSMILMSLSFIFLM